MQRLTGHSGPAHFDWMKFVNCARNEDEGNMLAFQYQGDMCIYYQASKDIYPGMELLVWYGAQGQNASISTPREGKIARLFACNLSTLLPD